MVHVLASLLNLLSTSVATITVAVFLFVILQRLTIFVCREDEKSNCYVLVTGCDSGFGYDTALELNRRNMFVFAGCLTPEGVAKINDDDNFIGRALLMDIRNFENVSQVKMEIEEVVKDKGLWCLVNNAGIIQLGPIDWLKIEQMQRVMDINLWGTINVTKTMLPLIKKARGRVVNMTSILGRVCTTNMSSYCMSKYALEAFSDCLRYEMKPWGISVHIIEPGSHSTPFLSGYEKQWGDLWNSLPKQMQEDYGDYFRKEIIVDLEKRAGKICSDPRNVVNAYCHAVLSPRPKVRYVVGTDANTIWLLLATIPTAMADFLRELLIKAKIPAEMKKDNAMQT